MDLEEALAQADVYAEETEVCTIDAVTRTISVPEQLRLFGVENDKRVERIYFHCPKIVGDNQDLSKDYQLFMNYQNANGDPDAYHIQDMEVDGDNITFSWLLEENVTKYRGSIQFAFGAIIPGGEAEDPDKNRWNTTINTDCACLVGLECTQQVAESNPDALAQIWAAIDELKAGGGGSVDPEQIKQAVNEYLDENPPSGGSGITVALKNALLNLASVVVYKDETSGASVYSALESALSQEVSNITLLKISVVCSVSEVAEKTTADELRKYLTVTAIYSDKSSEVVNDYDLEGTVVIGENRFTVTYNEKSATFMITGVKSDSFVKDITKVADVSMNASTGSDRVYAIYNVKAGDTIEYWASWNPSGYSPPKYYDHNPIVEGVDYTQSQTAYNGGASLLVDSSEYTHTVLVEYSYGKVTFNPVQDYACVVIRTNPIASTFSEVGATWMRN